MSSSYDEFITQASISEERWMEIANEHGLTVDEYKMIHRKAWESFKTPKHRMFMNVAIKGMVERYKNGIKDD